MMRQAALMLGVALLLLAGGAVLFVESGVYNIGADDHHTKPVLAIIEQLRERSIAVRVRAEVYEVTEPEGIAAGARRYAVLCAGCHLAPGILKSDIRLGMYPHPPSLAQGGELESRRAFWIVKHGIKMSAMPAWGKTLDDREIWDVVSFLRKMPGMTPESYQRITAAPDAANALR
jgi:mono/diheme cytochrome c family protein